MLVWWRTMCWMEIRKINVCEKQSKSSIVKRRILYTVGNGEFFIQLADAFPFISFLLTNNTTHFRHKINKFIITVQWKQHSIHGISISFFLTNVYFNCISDFNSCPTCVANGINSNVNKNGFISFLTVNNGIDMLGFCSSCWRI